MRNETDLRQFYTIEKTSPENIEVTITKEDVLSNEDRIHLAEYMLEDMMALYTANAEHAFSILFDIRHIKTEHEHLPKKASAIYKKVLAHEQTKKVAVVGETEKHAGALNLVLEILNPLLSLQPLGWFSTTEEAQMWLGK